jgi:hypothetical protein
LASVKFSLSERKTRVGALGKSSGPFVGQPRRSVAECAVRYCDRQDFPGFCGLEQHIAFATFPYRASSILTRLTVWSLVAVIRAINVGLV